MTRDTPQFGLRMPNDLKERIAAEASRNGRSINAEITARLWASLDNKKGAAAPLPAAPAVREELAPYLPLLTENERAMLTVFNKWPPEKQLSFLVLFR